MIKIAQFDAQGKKEKDATVSPEVFGLAVDPFALHRAVVTQLKNERVIGSHVKTRGLVSGGGKKPWKQKGTGRARVGSIRSPLWRGGGRVGIPKHNIKIAMPKKEWRRSLCSVLSEKQQQGALIVAPLNLGKAKTKELVSLLARFPIKGKTVYIATLIDQKIKAAAANLPFFNATAISHISPVTLLSSSTIIIDPKSLEQLEKSLQFKKQVIEVTT